MIFAKRQSYGVVESIFLKDKKIAYMNLCKVATPYGLTIGTSTSIADKKKICLKKSYSEYLERFSLGLPIENEQFTYTFDIVQKQLVKDKVKNYGYGDTIYGHNDTTGTATGIFSSQVVEKAVCELIEKNECLCFWYGDKGKRIPICGEVEEEIRNYNFISEKIYLYAIQEISSYFTVIALGIREERLIATGVSCTNKLDKSVRQALEELRVIEWQQFRNEKSSFCNYSDAEHYQIMQNIYKKEKKLDSYHWIECENKVEKLRFVEWIKNVRIKVIYSDDKLGLKTVKCISEELLSALPIHTNIRKAINKEIVKRYYDKKVVNCPIA